LNDRIVSIAYPFGQGDSKQSSVDVNRILVA
jgi:hypothetical protein